MAQSQQVEFAQPPRMTGVPEMDFPAMVDWMWSFYRDVILQRGLLPTSELASEIEDTLPTLSSLGTLEGTPGGILGFTAATTLASSVLLTLGAPVVGGGAGATPFPLPISAVATRYLANTGALNAAAWDTVNLTNGASGTLQAAQFPALLGDVTTSAGSLTTAIGANKVTLPMMAQIADARVLGNSSGITANVSALATLPTGVQDNITRLGTIASGVWNGSTIGTAYGGTGLTSYAAGDVPYASAINTLSALPIGASGKLLQSTGTVPGWSTPAWPTAAPAVGTFPRGDGTNYVGSTLVLPNAMTSGGVLYGSAANTVASSAALGSTQVVRGGGAGGAPNSSAGLTYNGTSLAVSGSGSQEITVTSTTKNATFRVDRGDAADAADFQLYSGGTGKYWFGLSRDGNDNFGIRTDPLDAGYQLFIQRTTGNVGIGGTTATYPLTIGYSGSTGANLNTTGTSFNVQRFTRSGTGLFTLGHESTTGGGFLLNSLANAAFLYGPNGIHIAANANAITGNITVATSGRVGLGITAPTAGLHLLAGTAAASTGPLKFTLPGVPVAIVEPGLLETDADYLYWTNNTPSRKWLTMSNAALTTGLIPVATTTGYLQNGPAYAAGVLTSGLTGAVNGTVGAITPNTGAFTTLSAASTITSTVTTDIDVFSAVTATTARKLARITNTGGGLVLGAESSLGGEAIIGSTAYDAVVRGETPIAFSADAGFNMHMRLSTTGLAITGTLSATSLGAYAAGDKYVIADASGNFHLSALDPGS